MRVRLGRPPSGWPTSAVFLANIDCIFYGDPEKTRHLRENVTGFSGYGTRMLPVLGLLHRGAGNVLLLAEGPDPLLRSYFGETLGLALPRIIRLGPIEAETTEARLAANEELLHELGRLPARRLDAYVSDPFMEDLAARIGKPLLNSYRESLHANDKVRLFRFLRDAGLPVFDGGEVAPGEGLGRRLDRLQSMGYARAVIRSSLGASGFGMSIVDLAERPRPPVPDFVSKKGSVLVHGWIEEGRRATGRILSPSVQFFCHDRNRATIFDVTQQILRDNAVHEGNVSPPAFPLAPGEEVFDELMRQARLVTAWVAGTGYQGTGSIDFLVFPATGRLHVHVCEVNARVTGATYPSLLARRFRPDGAWLMRNFGFDGCLDTARTFAVLESRGLLYRPGAPSGALPINLIAGPGGRLTKGQVLFLDESPAACRELVERFVRAMPPRCVYDRD